jgi:hypothetical protein
MTDLEAFKILAAEGLNGFGWNVTADDITDVEGMGVVITRLQTWWNGLDQFTRDLLNEVDIADALWNDGWMYEWPGFYTLIKGNPMGRFSSTVNDVLDSLRNASNRAVDYAAQHAVGRLEDDPALQGEAGNN